MQTPSSTSQPANAASSETNRFIYHITTRAAWNTAQQSGVYTAASLLTEGFIHCSLLHQVEATASRFFRGQKGLLVLKIDTFELNTRPVYEAAEGGELFPHVYGPVPVTAVVDFREMEVDTNGKFSILD